MLSQQVAYTLWILSLRLMMIASHTEKTEKTVILTESSGMIESPGYPENYPNNVAFNWRIHLPNQVSIEFTILNISIELSEQCKLDSLTIYQADGNATLVKLGQPMCGERCYSVRSLDDDNGCKINTIGQNFLIKFLSDETISSAGFRMFYNDRETFITEVCNGMHTNISDSGYIRSSAQTVIDDKYPENISCEWTITAPPGKDLILEVKHFDLKYSGPSCLEDYIELTIKFQNQSPPESIRYCGRRYYWQEGVYRQISEINIRFHSDAIDNDGGFEIFYKFSRFFNGYSVDVETVRLTKDTGEIVIPSLIGAHCLVTSSYCQTRLLIQADIGHRVRLTFHNDSVTPVVLAVNLLQVYDGISHKNAHEITENQRTPWDDVMFYSSGHYMSILVHVPSSFSAYIQQLNVSFDSEIVFLNRSTHVLPCTLTNYRLSRAREQDSWQLTFPGDNSSPEPSTICITKFDFNMQKSLQISVSHYYSDAANIDGCAFEGIVLYVDEVSESKIIGPFCDLRRNFVESVLNKLILTGRTFYLYLYSYTVKRANSKTTMIKMTIEETACKGIQLNTRFLPMMTSAQNESRIVLLQGGDAYHIFFNENTLFVDDDCVVISIFNLLVDNPSKPFRVHSNESFEICFYSVMDRVQSGRYITEECERADNGSLIGEFHWSFARIQKGEAFLPCPYSTSCVNEELSSDCGSIELLPMFNNDALDTPCTWKLYRGHLLSDKHHYFRIHIEIFKGLQFKIDEFFDYPCEINSEIIIGHLPFDVVIDSGVRDKEYKTIGAFCSILTFKYRIPDRKDVLIVHYSLEKYQLPNYNASEDAIYFNRKRYTRHPNLYGSYATHNEKCRNLSSSGHLVSINSGEELEQLRLALETVWRGDNPDRMAIAIGLTDLPKWREFRWADGNPLIYTDWYSGGSIEHTLPYSLRVRFSRVTIERQPAYNMATRCVIMVIGNPHYSTNWVKENCDTYDALRIGVNYFICESDEELKSNISLANMEESRALAGSNHSNINQQPTTNYAYVPSQIQTSLTCVGWEGNWYILNDLCILLKGYNIVNVDFTFDQAVKQCAGNSVLNVNEDNLELVLDYLQALDHNPVYGAIWVRHNQTGTACLQTSGQLTRERILGQHWTLSTKCHTAEIQVINAFEEDDIESGCTYELLGYNKTEVRGQDSSRNVLHKHLIRTICMPQYVLCMRPQEERESVPSCKHYQFTCYDGSCLSPDSLCDGYSDCIEEEDEKACGKPDTSFECNNKALIPISKYCDFQSDCSDGEDETTCEHVTQCRSAAGRYCRNKQCIRHSLLCNGFYNCIDQSDEDNCNSGNVCVELNAFLCSSGHCIAHVLRDDTVADCPDASDINLLREGSRVTETRCASDTADFFRRTELCIDENIYASNCRDLSHLHNCERFTCPWGYFKCTSSYCLPIRKVCDGKWDCLNGEDELNCGNYSCPGLLRCGRSTNCLSAIDEGNGRMDCPSDQSDMKYRDTWACPSECHCHGYVFDCRSNNITRLPGIQFDARVIILEHNYMEMDNSTFFYYPYLAILNLNSNRLTMLPINIFEMQHNLLKLYLKGNNIAYIRPGTFRNLGNLKYLDITKNPLEIIYTDTFTGLRQLPVLNISWCLITILHISAFRGLISLKDLDLSYNIIDSIEIGTFADLQKLESVNLTGNYLKMVSPEVFEEIHTNQLSTSSFRFCCFAVNADSCLPNKDVFSTCNDLMGNSFLQITIWITGVLSISGNCIVIVWRLLSGIDSIGLLFICNLAVSDLFIGVYLVVLASFDLHYRGEYIIHDVDWRESVVCKVIGFLATVSSQMSLFMLVCITADRFWKLVYPLSPKALSMRMARIVCGMGWIFTLLVCALPFSVYTYFGDFYGHNSVCVPYNFSPLLTSGWQYVLAVFIVPDTVACISMITAYVIMFRSISRSQKRIGLKSKESEIRMARKMFLIVITDLICWMPIVICSLSAYFGVSLNVDTVAFLTVLILPINGAVNPFLYTLTNFRKRANRDYSNAKTRQTYVPA